MKDNTVKALFAMGCLTVIEGVALLMGQDGTLLAAVIAALAGLGGWTAHAAVQQVALSKAFGGPKS